MSEDESLRRSLSVRTVDDPPLDLGDIDLEQVGDGGVCEAAADVLERERREAEQADLAL